MRNIADDLRARLRILEDEHQAIQRRLQALDEMERALKLLLTEEAHGRQLSLLSAKSPDGRAVVGRTPLSRFLVEALADGEPRALKALAELAVARGLDFKGKNPSRVLHFALIGLQKNGYTRMVSRSIWQLVKRSEETQRDSP